MKEPERTALQEQRDQFTVVLEDIQTHNRAFGDMLMGMNDKLNSVFEEVGRLREDVTEIREDVDELKVDVRVLKTDVAELKIDVCGIHKDIVMTNNNKADKSEVEILKSRVGRLELTH